MKRALSLASDVEHIGVIQNLASAFEGIASLRIAKIKNRVVSSKSFFDELWHIYTQLRSDSHKLSSGKSENTKGKDVFVVVTSEGGLSGDIDSKIIDKVMSEFNKTTTEIIILGSHGAILLAQAGVAAAKGYKLPDTDESLDVSPIIAELEKYRHSTVFYQTYESLGVQSVGRIDLVAAVQSLSQDSKKSAEIISSVDYIFEPSLPEIVSYMEAVVLGLTLSQVILESRLAQYASRFNAMSAAKQRAKDLKNDMTLDWRRAKRGESDSRLKEVIVAMNLL